MTVQQLELVKGERTYGELQRTPNGWMVTNVEPHVAIKLKHIFTQIPKASADKYFLTGGDDVAEDLLWFMVRYPFELSGEDLADLRDRRATVQSHRAEADRILLPDWKPEGAIAFNEKMEPYLYQRQASALTLKMGRILLMDEVGLGKTVSGLTVIVESGAMPAAVVVQAHLAEQWSDVIEEFTALRAHIIKGTSVYDLPEADIYIFKYSNIAGWVDVAARGIFRTVIFDEMQELRTGQSTAKGMAARVFCYQAKLRMGLTATPVYNYGDEIFNIIDLLAPGALGNLYDFMREWGKGQRVIQDPQALGAYLRDQQLVLRRTEDDVGSQMPPVNTLPILVPYDEDLAEEAAAVARMLALKVMEGSFVERGQAARELDALARLQTGLAKAHHVAGYVRMLVEAGEPVLLAGWHRDVYDIWLKELEDLNPLMYTGSETGAKKRRTKEGFLSGESDIMIISLRSGAGLDGLQNRCNTAVFGELDWSPMVHKQVVGRLRRPGQKRQVDAVYCHADGGSDPVLMETLGVKASQARGITDPTAGIEMVHSDDSRIKRLASYFLQHRDKEMR